MFKRWFLYLFLANKPVWNETYADILKRDLLISYDKFARPTQHNNTTSVIVDLQLKHFDLDEAASVFTIYAWFSMVIETLLTRKLLFLINFFPLIFSNGTMINLNGMQQIMATWQSKAHFLHVEYGCNFNLFLVIITFFQIISNSKFTD